MSDTPRTDAKASDWNEFNIYDGDAVVPASFARILERENATLLKRLDSVQKSHFTLSKDNAALRDTIAKCRFYVTNWQAYDDDSAYKRLEVLRKMDPFIDPATKEQP